MAKSIKQDLPSGAGLLASRHRDVWAAYEKLGEAVSRGGPLNAKTRRLVKLALAIGGGSEGAVHSHVRRGLVEGVTANEMRHLALLAIPTLGLPAAVKALTWMDDILDSKADRPSRLKLRRTTKRRHVVSAAEM